MSDTGAALGSDFLKITIQELRKLKEQGEKAIAQLGEEKRLHVRLDDESNSIDILVRHLAGNMVSRWSDFLTTDGEKPTRNRDAEFEPSPSLSRIELMTAWEKGWTTLFDTLTTLTHANLLQTVRVQGREMSAVDAILRQFSHYAAHVGQIVFLAKHLEWQHWQTLSRPRKRPGKA